MGLFGRLFRSVRKNAHVLSDKGMQAKAPLREFVYLDETSVFSLLSSLVGHIEEEVTESSGTSSSAQVSTALGLGSDHVMKADVSTLSDEGRTSETQTVRKATVQAKFRMLRNQIDSQLLVRAASTPADIERHTDGASLDDLRDAGLIIDVADLLRGKPIELRLDLEAEPLYKISAVVSSLVGIMDEDAATLGMDTAVQAKVQAFSRLLDRLLDGLVPVRGTAVDLVVVHCGDRMWLCQRAVAASLPCFTRPPIPLVVVGVAARASFWRDIRRVLFSRQRFTVLCRLNQDGLATSWTPVKLVEVLETVLPGAGLMFESLPKTLERAMTERLQDKTVTSRDEAENERVFRRYAQLIAAHHRVGLDEAMTAELDRVVKHNRNVALDDIPGRRGAFDSVAAVIQQGAATPFDRMALAQMRNEAVNGGQTPGPTPEGNPDVTRPEARAEERFLDVEFIAMYW